MKETVFADDADSPVSRTEFKFLHYQLSGNGDSTLPLAQKKKIYIYI